MNDLMDLDKVKMMTTGREGLTVETRHALYVARVSEDVKQPARLYLPTLSDLIDRLAIVQMKAIFIPARAEEYAEERRLIEHDIDLILKDCPRLDARAVHAILVIMLANRFIWENESKAREGADDQNDRLRLTHSINGVRNAAKNELAGVVGGRKDYKIDALAADLPPEFGNWRVFE
jgi:hypothetical protein